MNPAEALAARDAIIDRSAAADADLEKWLNGWRFWLRPRTADRYISAALREKTRCVRDLRDLTASLS